MNTKSRLGLAPALLIAGLAGCANVDGVGTNKGAPVEDLGPGKQEFETSAQGGRYRFEYVTEGADGYRTVFWRQGDPLSDDAKDSGLATNVVRTVFQERFCKELKLPVSIADGSPAPTGNIGIWTASLRCAVPPPKPKETKPEKAPKKKEPPAASGETASKSGETPKPASEASSGETKPKTKPASSAHDGPMVCEKTASGFECKPKK